MKGNEFQVHVILPTGPAGISPEAACKWDSETFLRFAKEVVRVAQGEMIKKAQLDSTVLLDDELINIRPIETSEDHKAALEEIDRLFDAEPDTPEEDRLKVLAILVEAYEKEHYPISPPSSDEAIEYYLESRGLEPSLRPIVLDLYNLIGRERDRQKRYNPPPRNASLPKTPPPPPPPKGESV